MKIEDRIIKLAVRKIIGEASAEELQELNDLLEKDVDMQQTLTVLLRKWTYQEPVPDDRSHLLLERIKKKIEGKG